jgi:hypothetical protein
MKKASVDAFRVWRRHVQGLLAQGVAVFGPAPRTKSKSAAVPAKRKAVDELVGTNP